MNDSTTTFTYDQRDRLTRELRTSAYNPEQYDLSYTYDQLGNRLSKTDNDSGLFTVYQYDVTDPEPGYATLNNRLITYDVYDPDFEGGTTALREVHYVYWPTGDVSNIIVKDTYTGSGVEADFDWYHDMALYYSTAGQLWEVLWDRWKLVDDEVTDYTKDSAREFRYDAPRQRYMSRGLDPSDFTPLGLAYTDWTDYAGDSPYLDYTVALDGGSHPIATNVTRYTAGCGKKTVSGGAVSYFHGDLIDSTVLTTDAGGDSSGVTAYTAFGEPIGTPAADSGRYGYAGGWGYESGVISLSGVSGSLPPITLQHVGARWYQPGIGRFVQRDPIGLGGGLDVYAYVGSRPTELVDPDGLITDEYQHVPPRGPLPRIDGPVGPLVLNGTGGEERTWLDDPNSVGRAQKFSFNAGMICTLAIPGVGPTVKVLVGLDALIYNTYANP